MVAMGSGAVSREGGKLPIRASIPRTVLMVLGSALFVVAGGAICAMGLFGLLTKTAGMSYFGLAVVALVDSFYVLVGLAAIVFFGFTLLFALGRLLFFWRPIFEVGPEGILDRASAGSVGFVPWEEVKGVRPGTISGQRFLAIRVKDEQALLERQNLVKRFLMRLNRRYFTGAIVNVPLNALAIPEEELLAEIKPHLSPPTRRRLEEFQREAESARAKPRAKSEGTRGRRRPGSTTARIAVLIVRWIAVVVLSIFYYTVSSMLVLLGGLLAWNGLSPGMGRNPDAAHPVSGAILVLLGILVFIFFPRVVKRLTGREVLSGPYGGF